MLLSHLKNKQQFLKIIKQCQCPAFPKCLMILQSESASRQNPQDYVFLMFFMDQPEIKKESILIYR